MILKVNKTIKKFLIVVITTIIIIFILKVIKNDDPLIEENTETKTVNVMRVNLKSLQPEHLLYGNIKGINQIEVTSKLNGKVIYVSPKVFESSDFKKGEIIFKIDDFKYKQELLEKKSILYDSQNELEATNLIYEETIKQLDLSEKNYKRMKKLYGDIITKKGLEEAELNFSLTRAKMLNVESKIKSIKSNIEVSEAQVSLAKRNLSDTNYKAPFDGQIHNSLIEVGAEVVSGKRLGILTNTNLLNVEFFVGETVYTKLGNILNKQVKVIWKNSSFKNTYIGNVIYIDSAIDKDRAGLNMKARLEYIDLLDPIMPGVFVEVIIEGKEVINAILVDESSIYEDEYVYILKNNRPLKREIDIKGNIGAKVIISGNLNQNEELIITRLTDIKGNKKLYFKNSHEK